MTVPVDYVRSQGGASLGARLRRLSDRIDRESDGIYQALGIEFEQRWFGLVNQLALHEQRTVGEVADALGVSHAAISQVRRALVERGLVIAEADPGDSRRKTLMLSAKGKRLAAKLSPIWNALNGAARELDAESGAVTRALERLEQALDARTLAARVQEKL